MSNGGAALLVVLAATAWVFSGGRTDHNPTVPPSRVLFSGMTKGLFVEQHMALCRPPVSKRAVAEAFFHLVLRHSGEHKVTPSDIAALTPHGGGRALNEVVLWMEGKDGLSREEFAGIVVQLSSSGYDEIKTLVNAAVEVEVKEYRATLRRVFDYMDTNQDGSLGDLTFLRSAHVLEHVGALLAPPLSPGYLTGTARGALLARVQSSLAEKSDGDAPPTADYGAASVLSGIGEVKQRTAPTATLSASTCDSGVCKMCGSAPASMRVKFSGSIPFNFTVLKDGHVFVSKVFHQNMHYDIETTEPGTYTILDKTRAFPVDGGVLLGDVCCLGTATGSVLVKYKPCPTWKLLSSEVCAGTPVALTLGGEAPWTVEYTLGMTTTSRVTSRSAFDIPTDAPGVFRLDSLRDTNCRECPSSPCPSGGKCPTGGETMSPRRRGAIVHQRPRGRLVGKSRLVCDLDKPTLAMELGGRPPFAVALGLTRPDGEVVVLEHVLQHGKVSAPASPSHHFELPIQDTGVFRLLNVSDASGCPALLGTEEVSISRVNPPRAVLSGGHIREGHTQPLVVTLTGHAPFEITMTDGMTKWVVTGITSKTYLIPLSKTGRYSVVSVSDMSLCTEGFTEGNVDVDTLILPSGATFTSKEHAQAVRSDERGEDIDEGEIDRLDTEVALEHEQRARRAKRKAETDWNVRDGQDAAVEPAPEDDAVFPWVSLVPSRGDRVVEGSLVRCAAEKDGHKLAVELHGTPPFVLQHEVVDSTGEHHIMDTTTAEHEALLDVPDGGSVRIVFIADARFAGRPSTNERDSGRAPVLTADVRNPIMATLTGGGAMCADGSHANGSMTVALPGASPPVSFTLKNVHAGERIARTALQSTTTHISLEGVRPGEYMIEEVSDAFCTFPSPSSDVVAVGATERPTAHLSGGGFCCEGSETITPLRTKASCHLRVQLTGTSPWTITYQAKRGPAFPATTHELVILEKDYSFFVGHSATFTVVTVTDRYGCPGAASGSATCSLRLRPSLKVVSGEHACSSGLVNLALQGTPPFDVTYENNGHPKTVRGINEYEWSTTVQPGDVRFTAISDSYCDALPSATSASVSVGTAPTARLELPRNVLPLLCGKASMTLDVTLTGSPPWRLQYSFTSVDGVVSTPVVSAEEARYRLRAREAGRYSLVRVEDARGCHGQVHGDVVVEAAALPTANLAGHEDICPGKSVNLTLSVSGVPPWTVVYTDGVSYWKAERSVRSSAVEVSGTGLYRLVAVQDALCSFCLENSASYCTSLGVGTAWSDEGELLPS